MQEEQNRRQFLGLLLALPLGGLVGLAASALALPDKQSRREPFPKGLTVWRIGTDQHPARSQDLERYKEALHLMRHQGNHGLTLLTTHECEADSLPERDLQDLLRKARLFSSCPR
jgi:hypothetical protein